LNTKTIVIVSLTIVSFFVFLTPYSNASDSSPIDNIPPVVTVPPNQLVIAADSRAVVNFTQPTATDNVEVTSGPTCTLGSSTIVSGMIFSIGTWVITCTASDAAGNVGSAMFTISVQPQSQSSTPSLDNKVSINTGLWSGQNTNQKYILVNEPLYFSWHISSLNYFNSKCIIHLKIYDSSNILVSDQKSYCDLGTGEDIVGTSWQPSTTGSFTAMMSVIDNTSNQTELALPWSIPFIVNGSPQSFPITVSTDKTHYVIGDLITVSGTSTPNATYVQDNFGVYSIQKADIISIQVMDSLGNLKAIGQPNLSQDGKYSFQLQAGSLRNSGSYTVITEQGQNSRAEIKFWIDSNGTISPTYTPETNSSYQIPSWIHNNAKWWHDNSIGDNDFEKGIQYLIQQKIIKIPSTTTSSSTSNQVPSWIKNNAGWWANGQISDDEFVKGIQYLISEGIIEIQSSTCIAINDILPDPNCTPGATDPAVTQDNIDSTICVSGYTKTVRPPTSVTNPIKLERMQAYGFTDSKSNYELDHLIPLEVGGAQMM
jgi:hypothetical protein